MHEVNETTVLVNTQDYSIVIDVCTGITLWEVNHNKGENKVIVGGANCIVNDCRLNKELQVWNLDRNEIVDIIPHDHISTEFLGTFFHFKDAHVFVAGLHHCFIVNVETRVVTTLNLDHGGHAHAIYNLGAFFLIYAKYLIILATETMATLQMCSDQNVVGSSPKMLTKDLIIGNNTDRIVIYNPRTDTSRIISTNFLPSRVFSIDEHRAFIFASWKTSPVTLFYYYGGFVHDLRKPLKIHQRTNFPDKYERVFGLLPKTRYKLWRSTLLLQSLAANIYFSDVEIITV